MYTKRRRKKEGEERGIPGEYQFKTTFRRIPRIAYTYAVLFVIPFHQPLGPGCCFIISFLPCTPLSIPRRRPICLCAHRYYACCIMHCAARWTCARMRAPTPLSKMPKSGGDTRCTSSRCIWHRGRATIREMLKDSTGLDYAIETRFQSRNSYLVSLHLFFLRREGDIKVEIFSKQRLYGVNISSMLRFFFHFHSKFRNEWFVMDFNSFLSWNSFNLKRERKKENWTYCSLVERNFARGIGIWLVNLEHIYFYNQKNLNLD